MTGAGADGSSLLAVERLVIVGGGGVAMKGIDLLVREGQVVCLIGPNGAGEDHPAARAVGPAAPGRGAISGWAVEITGQPPHRIAAMGLRHMQAGRQLFAGLTVAENLALGAWLADGAAEIARRQEEVLLRLPRLRACRTRPAGSLPGGEQQMLALGRALMGAPRLLLLDEPGMGLAPPLVEEMFAIIADLRREGRSILLVEQNTAAALEAADYAYVLESGRIMRQGPAMELAQDAAVPAAYPGG